MVTEEYLRSIIKVLKEEGLATFAVSWESPGEGVSVQGSFLVSKPRSEPGDITAGSNSPVAPRRQPDDEQFFQFWDNATKGANE